MKIPYLLHQVLLSLLLALMTCNSFAANKIVLVAGTDETKKGLLAGLTEGLTQEIDDPNLPPDAVRPLLSFDPAVNSYTLNNYVIEFEDDADKLMDITQDSEVVAVLCKNSTVCGKALLEVASEDVLVIALTATSSELSFGTNILRLAPSNSLQASLLHEVINENLTPEQRYAIVYEPTLYGLDLYKNFISTQVQKRLRSDSMPQIAFALPLHTHLTLQPEQKFIDANRILSMLEKNKVDAVAYFGYLDGFRELADDKKGGKHNITDYWYAGDGIEELDLKAENFTNTSIVGLFYAQNDNSSVATYYYAYDSGKFLRAIMEQGQFTQEKVDRTAFLEKAKTIVLPANQTKTGAKSFTSADSESYFFIHYLNEEQQKLTDIITVTVD